MGGGCAERLDLLIRRSMQWGRLHRRACRLQNRHKVPLLAGHCNVN